MTNEIPCRAPGADPDDWFIGRDGKQYPDEDFLTEVEVRGISTSVLPKVGETAEEHAARVEAALAAARRDRRRFALQRRRNARQACYSCPIRNACLQQGVDGNHFHGIWGGLFEEELREVRRRLNNK